MVNPITVGTLLSSLIAYWWVGLKDLSIDEMVGPDALVVVRPTRVYLLDFFCSSIQSYVLLSPYLCFISLLCLHLYVLGDNSWIS